MGSHALKVLRQGVWGSLTGGWYHDPHHSKFTNVFHLYAWLVFMCLPFSFYLAFEPSWAVVGSYAAAIFTLFIMVKTVNYRLHSMFDHGEIVDRREVQTEDPNTIERVHEDNENFQDRITTVLSDVFPVAGSGEAATGHTGRKTSDFHGSRDSVAIDMINIETNMNEENRNKRELEVDIHMESNILGHGQNQPWSEITKACKKEDKIRTRVHPKTVIFKEPTKVKKRRLGVDRCVSLSSASPTSDSDNTDDDEDSMTDSGLSTSVDSDMNEDKSTDDGKKHSAEGSTKLKKFRPSSRPMKRRAGIRGITKHPWYKNPDRIQPATKSASPKNAADNNASDLSSDCFDETSQARTDPSDVQMKPNLSRTARSISRRKRVSGERPSISPQRKWSAKDESTSESSPALDMACISRSIPPPPKDCENENSGGGRDKETPTSDQELLTQDPVWRARRSGRYSSDNRLFFRRRSYAINSYGCRSSDREVGRRCSSTLPQYSHPRRVSSARRPASSFQRFWSMCSRDNSMPGDASPGEVSPGQVRKILFDENLVSRVNELPEIVKTPPLKEDATKVDLSKTTSEVLSPDCEAFLPFNDEMLSAQKQRLTDPKNRDLHIIRQLSESSSYNSNPHCNEVSLNTSVVKKDGESRENASSSQTRKPKKAKRRRGTASTERSEKKTVKANENKLYQIELNGDTTQELVMGSSPRLRSRPRHGPEGYDSEEDMKTFLGTILNAADNWNVNRDTISPISGQTDPETGMESLPATTRRRTGSTNRERTFHQTNSCRVSELPSLSQQQSGDLSPLSIVASTGTRSPTLTRQRISSSASAPSGGSSSKRVRHPAGNSHNGSHSRFNSNTSEEVGLPRKNIQAISANSVASTTELLSTAHNEQLPPEVVEKLEVAENDPAIHIAIEHNDTTAGAIHAFQDENGQWLTYTFGQTSQGIATSLGDGLSLPSSLRRRNRTMSSGRQSVDTTDSARSPSTSRRDRRRMREFPRVREYAHRLSRRLARPERTSFPDGSDGSGSYSHPSSHEISLDFILNSRPASSTKKLWSPKVKLFYKYQLFPCKSITVQYDRLALHDLFDRNQHLLENLLTVLLATLVAVLGFLLLWKGFFLDVWPLWFCAVIATSHHSLVRSVQPDSASPMHGHNRIIAYSRPIYFCIVALLILLFDFLGNSENAVSNTYVYADLYFTRESCLFARDVLIVFIMILPFIFLLGLLPQINTFIIYITEQVDIHMFGGTACTGLAGGLYSVTRSLLVCCLLFGFCYGGMKHPEKSQHILFSVFCGLLVSFSYHLSRQTSNPLHIWDIIKEKLLPCDQTATTENGSSPVEVEEDNPDDLSFVYVRQALTERLQSDLIVCPLIAIFMFAIHCSTAFTELQPSLSLVLYIFAGVLGFLTHYLLPQLRKQLPWLLFAEPILKSKEHDLFEVQEEAQVTWFERVYLWLSYFERNILYPIIILNELTRDGPVIIQLYGLVWGSVILTFVGFKLIRSAYCTTLLQFAVLGFAALFTNYDARNLQDPVLITYFLFSILIIKLQDLMLKLQFILVYIAPWQITWGSAFHAFAQPFSVPHSGMLLLNTIVSSIFHAPLSPFFGSAVFLTSYIRPVKFWERNYKTKRVDNSNTRLASQIDRSLVSDDNNLNSIFYEHLTLSLQKSLCGDIAMGRWGNVYPGDCFIMASDYLNALVYIIQRGNGMITFQLRGLEFSGTYCQQREVEAITEGVGENYGFCCFRPGRLKNMLSLNSAFNQRWLAWQIQTTKYVLDGYGITDNSATSMLGVYDLRKILVSYMVKSVIYFLVSHSSLESWLESEAILAATVVCEEPNYVDMNSNFSVTIHEDYDMVRSGISRDRFEAVYGEWIRFCSSKRDQPLENHFKVVSLCYLISVLTRRALVTVSNHLTANCVVLESFLYRLHSLFKGDFRITSPKDEWVFTDMDLLHHVVAPGVRMSLKLHQDHFQNAEDEDNLEALYDVITDYNNNMVITHEADPNWRKAVLSNRPSLLALRQVAGDSHAGHDSYFVITLKRRSLGFRVVKVNKECVKGLWAGQQQELVFLRNRNPERGSIQNAKQVLRNMINSSCDQPIGYPIYVSPITTSFSNSHSQHKKIVGGSITLGSIRGFLSNMWICIQQSCGGGCNSGGSAGITLGQDAARFRPPPVNRQPSQVGLNQPAVQGSITVSSQSSSNPSNSGTVRISPADLSEQVTISRMLQTSMSSRRTSSVDHRRHVRSNTDDQTTSGGRLSLKWSTGPDGLKSGLSEPIRHHSCGTGMEMSPLNSKILLSSGKSLREYRREGTESAGNSDIIASSIGSGSRKIKKSMSVATHSSSSSSISRGESLTVISGQLVTHTKPTRMSSRDSFESDVRSSTRDSKSKENSTVKSSSISLIAKKKSKLDKELLIIEDTSRIFETLNVPRRRDFVTWPNEEWRQTAGKNGWKSWRAKEGTVGEVVYRWYPSHRDPSMRAHIGETIVLLKVENPNSTKLPFYVPIPESCTSNFSGGVTMSDTTRL